MEPQRTERLLGKRRLQKQCFHWKHLLSSRTSKEMLKTRGLRDITFFSFSYIPSTLEIHLAFGCKHLPNLKKEIGFFFNKKCLQWAICFS